MIPASKPTSRRTTSRSATLPPRIEAYWNGCAWVELSRGEEINADLLAEKGCRRPREVLTSLGSEWSEERLCPAATCLARTRFLASARPLSYSAAGHELARRGRVRVPFVSPSAVEMLLAGAAARLRVSVCRVSSRRGTRRRRSRREAGRLTSVVGSRAAGRVAAPTDLCRRSGGRALCPFAVRCLHRIELAGGPAVRRPPFTRRSGWCRRRRRSWPVLSAPT